MALYSARGPADMQYTPFHMQELQIWKDQMSQTLMVLEANIEIIASLRKFYLALNTNRDLPLAFKRVCKEEIVAFAANLDEIIDALKMHALRVRLLVSIIADRKELVRLFIDPVSENKRV